ncbi:MAG: hypothetical protein QGH90_07585, partial [Candidatus Poseidoniaceae archaeon]|nr:hypothetical protein [Candidatus Poseidoniaceae archaeon]
MGARHRCAIIRSLLVVAVLSTITFLPTTLAESTSENGAAVMSPANFSLELIFPVLTAFAIAIFMWRFLVPNSLSSLQIAFEIDDALYEVHRLTRTREEARELLRLPSVGFGVALYLMAMTGILILVGELTFQPNTYYQLNVFLIFLLILIPILFSPWETLTAQVGMFYRDKVRVKWYIKLMRRA